MLQESMFTTLIIEDEEKQQQLLTDLLQESFPQYQLAGVCSCLEDGIEKIYAHQPQLVFLDVEIPPHNCFDLLDRIGRINFEIIFTTSYEKYAIRAFRVSAVDYLLKPFGKEELEAALEKFEQRMIQKNSLQHFETLLHNMRTDAGGQVKIALPTLTGFNFVFVKDIIRCEADNAYTTFHFADKSRQVVTRSIKECEELLSEYDFFRVHNSHLINLKQLKEYLKGEGGYVKMMDGSAVEVSRLRKAAFLNKLHKI